VAQQLDRHQLAGICNCSQDLRRDLHRASADC
jgi:hypothetical protein